MDWWYWSWAAVGLAVALLFGVRHYSQRLFRWLGWVTAFGLLPVLGAGVIGAWSFDTRPGPFMVYAAPFLTGVVVLYIRLVMDTQGRHNMVEDRTPQDEEKEPRSTREGTRIFLLAMIPVYAWTGLTVVMVLDLTHTPVGPLGWWMWLLWGASNMFYFFLGSRSMGRHGAGPRSSSVPE
jgi:hypothetical protein